MLFACSIESKKEPNDPKDRSKHRIASILIGAVLVVLVISTVWNGDDKTPGEGTITPPDQDPEIQITTLNDRPPIPLTDREGTIVFGNYSNHDMNPECTVTDVSARLINAQGFVEVVDDAVGTNNLHVAVEYSADRDMARTEITWEVEHPSNVECTLN
jgi:hypothetical protein